MVEAPVAFDLALLDLNVPAGPLLRHHELRKNITVGLQSSQTRHSINALTI